MTDAAELMQIVHRVFRKLIDDLPGDNAGKLVNDDLSDIRSVMSNSRVSWLVCSCSHCVNKWWRPDDRGWNELFLP